MKPSVGLPVNITDSYSISWTSVKIRLHKNYHKHKVICDGTGFARFWMSFSYKKHKEKRVPDGT